MTAGHHLAQLNVARLRAPLDDPALEPFVERLAVVNADADGAPGFVWRLADEEGESATSIRPWGDDMIVNMSVWTSLEALRDFVLAGRHLEILRRRREFFVPFDGTYAVLWWVEAGHLPDLDEAKDRLELLAAHGPSERAFSMRMPYPAPQAPGVDVPR